MRERAESHDSAFFCRRFLPQHCSLVIIAVGPRGELRGERVRRGVSPIDASPPVNDKSQRYATALSD